MKERDERIEVVSYDEGWPDAYRERLASYGRCWALRRRNFLRTYPDEAARYETMKRTAAQDAPFLLAYSETKAPHIGQLLERAKQWSARRADFEK